VAQLAEASKDFQSWVVQAGKYPDLGIFNIQYSCLACKEKLLQMGYNKFVVMKLKN